MLQEKAETVHIPFLSGLIQDATLQGRLSLQVTPEMVKGNTDLEPLCEDPNLHKVLKDILHNLDIDLKVEPKSQNNFSLEFQWFQTLQQKEKKKEKSVAFEQEKGGKEEKGEKKEQDTGHQATTQKEEKPEVIRESPEKYSDSSFILERRSSVEDLEGEREESREELSWAQQVERHLEKHSEKHSDEGEEAHPHGDERRRTRPRPSVHKIGEKVIIPNTLKEVLEGVTVQHLAMENWSRKRLVLVGRGSPTWRRKKKNKAATFCAQNRRKSDNSEYLKRGT
eukprot:TRINITY_DN6068_c0_g1_i2.p2 TRINITY_DN6068_c0_g1~~TRINITY_DN6068_c0_g1_i2.p2  ORF type:complete len:281 (+),score=84.98 TRINITY_DN6068_c0_g1_i2:139-981(+)